MHEDLIVAEYLREKDDELTTSICFHLQQYVEKSLKARLMELSIPYGKVHDLLLLVQMLPEGAQIESKYSDDLIALSHFATTAYIVHARLTLMKWNVRSKWHRR